jgi:hypothetical protein
MLFSYTFIHRQESSMHKTSVILATILGLSILTVSQAVFAAPPKSGTVVTTGKVIRGVTLPGPVGATGTSTGVTCDFSGEDVDQNKKIEDASVNCKQGGTDTQVLRGLPQRFNAYCIIDAPVRSGRLITAPMSGNDQHCSLSGITITDATQQFGGAVWR